MNTYFVLSDIHSRKVVMQDFLDKGFTPKDPTHYIVLLGDFFDRYDDSYDVLLFAEYVKKEYGDRAILIKGNHDEMLENIMNQIIKSDLYSEIYYDKIDYALFANNGGKKTIRDLFGGITPAATMTPAKMQRAKRLCKFLDSLKYVYETEDFIFVHAGFDEEGNPDTWTIDTLFNENKTGKKIVAGHYAFEYIKDEPGIIIKDYGSGKVAINDNLKNDVFLVDNGLGNNIVRFNGY